MTKENGGPMRTTLLDAGTIVADLAVLQDLNRPTNRRLPKLSLDLKGNDLPREEILILHPASGATVESPLSAAGVTGLSRGTLMVTILDAGGAPIGNGAASMNPTISGLAYFAALVPFIPPTNTQRGRLQVWFESDYDGAVEHLNSLTVQLQGLDLDPLLERLEKALLTKDYCGLQGAVAAPFLVIHQNSEHQDLIDTAELERFLRLWLEEGSPELDFTISPQHFLATPTVSSLDLIHAVYSSGWGLAGGSSAWLLIGKVEGRARWTGIYFLPR